MLAVTVQTVGLGQERRGRLDRRDDDRFRGSLVQRRVERGFRQDAPAGAPRAHRARRYRQPRQLGGVGGDVRSGRRGSEAVTDRQSSDHRVRVKSDRVQSQERGEQGHGRAERLVLQSRAGGRGPQADALRVDANHRHALLRHRRQGQLQLPVAVPVHDSRHEGQVKVSRVRQGRDRRERQHWRGGGAAHRFVSRLDARNRLVSGRRARRKRVRRDLQKRSAGNGEGVREQVRIVHGRRDGRAVGSFVPPEQERADAGRGGDHGAAHALTKGGAETRGERPGTAQPRSHARSARARALEPVRPHRVFGHHHGAGHAAQGFDRGLLPALPVPRRLARGVHRQRRAGGVHQHRHLASHGFHAGGGGDAVHALRAALPVTRKRARRFLMGRNRHVVTLCRLYNDSSLASVALTRKNFFVRAPRRAPRPEGAPSS
mmetsp:Transcript_8396/g.35112  ORF Transcript_8396/g.35112 Transcript_8396/m.35112 type:complete len:431 (-) Transcript_8396:1108-2400(-)